jgi:tetratricopeptide (TPR) repeat protein
MTVPHKVLWAIDNELDGKAFERLCVDLLYRAGYKEIVPIAPQDAGRDAEEHPRRGRGRAGEAAFFQFSKEEDWRRKLRRDGAKLHDGGFEFSRLVFVTSRNAGGTIVDALAADFRSEHNWELTVYGREWLRHQLEQVHPDLAKIHLGVEPAEGSPWLMARLQFNRAPDERLSHAWSAFDARKFERAAVEFREFLDEYPEASADVWQALAWCQYEGYRYAEALASIQRALRLQATVQAQGIHGCILVEKGIRHSDRSCLLEGRRVFEAVLASGANRNWQVIYNLGNVESALGGQAKAIALYRRALEIEPREPQVWKNLASAYHLTGEHAEEMRCFDEVLTIQPDQFEALVSKGTSLMVDFDRPRDASFLLERALKMNPDKAVQWPHVWYWLADAHRRSGDSRQALRRVDEGLAHQPGDPGMRRLKSDVLLELATKAPDMVATARDYWRLRLNDEPRDYVVRSRLAQLEDVTGNRDAAWALLDECFQLVGFEAGALVRDSGFSVAECVDALRYLPQYIVFRRKRTIASYWDADDPLYDLPFRPPPADAVQEALAVYLAVPFGLGVASLERIQQDRDQPNVLVAHANELRPFVTQALVQAARRFPMPPADSGASALAEAVTDVLLFVYLIALREFARQRGWMWGQFGLSQETIAQALDLVDEGHIGQDVTSALFVALSEEIRARTNRPATE